MRKVITLLPTLIFLHSMMVGCKQQDKQPKNLLAALTETGRLVTAEYTLQKVIRASDQNTWFKIGNRKILMTCEAHLKAGVDMQRLTEKEVQPSGKAVTIYLPHAELFSLSIPPDKIKLHYEETGMLRDGFKATEREALLRQAEEQIKKISDSLGILKTAEVNAAVFVRNLMNKSGFKEVNILFR